MISGTAKKPVRNPLPATEKTAQAKQPTWLTDDQMLRAYRVMEFREGAREAWELHTNHTYEQAVFRRGYRQAHVLEHWDERDRRILFLLILGWGPKRIAAHIGITRQAVEKRLNVMLNKTGMDEYTQLVLWFLGFIALRDGLKTAPGTTLIESCEADQNLLRYRDAR